MSKTKLREDSLSKKKSPPPQRMTVDELETTYQTSAVKGLSRKEAGRRQSAGNSLFFVSGQSLWRCIRAMFADPILWLLLVVGVLAVCFDRAALGAACISLAVINAAVCGFTEYRGRSIDRSLQQADLPLSRVLRNGTVARIRAQDVVVGDVVLLETGDLIPADARVIAAYGLRVSDPYPDDAQHIRMVERDVNAEALSEAEHPLKTAYFYGNMVNGGGVVVAGCGRAVVTATGDATHLMAMKGPVLPSRHGTHPRGRSVIRQNQMALYFVMIGCMLPLVGVGILVSSDEYGLLDLMLTALALAVVCIPRYSLSWMRLVSARMRAATAGQRDFDNSAEIKTVGVMESLNQMTDLVLIGTAALHDGLLHPKGIFCDGQMHMVGQSEPEDSIKRWSALLNLANRRWQNELTVGGDSSLGGDRHPSPWAVKTVSQWAEPDMAEWNLRILSVIPWETGVRVTYKDRTVRDIYVTQDSNVLYRADQFISGNSPATASDEQRHEAYRAYREAVGMGYHVWFLVSACEGKSCLEGFLTLAFHGCRKAKGYLQDMEKAGIRTTVFLKDVHRETANERFLSQYGFTSCVYEGQNVWQLREQGINAILGVTEDDIVQFVKTVQKEGGRVGVLSVDHDDLPALQSADVAFTCSPDRYAGQALPRVWEDDAREGRSERVGATDLMRRRADVLIRRCNEHGGGVCGIRNALLCATEYAGHLQWSACYVLIAQVVRFLFVCFGFLSLPSSVMLLMSGWGVDALVVMLYSRSRRSYVRKTGVSLKRPRSLGVAFANYIPQMIVAAVAVVAGWSVLWWMGGQDPSLLHRTAGRVLIGAVLLIDQISVAIACRFAKGEGCSRGAKD